MNSQPEDSTASPCVALPASCTLKESAAVKTLLVQGLDQAGDIRLDLSAVERVDTSVLQLLVAFSRDMKDAGRAVDWVGCNAEFQRAARQLGLDGVLGLGRSESRHAD
jgi:anti-anti-sigma regulatory factor